MFHPILVKKWMRARTLGVYEVGRPFVLHTAQHMVRSGEKSDL